MQILSEILAAAGGVAFLIFVLIVIIQVSYEKTKMRKAQGYSSPAFFIAIILAVILIVGLVIAGIKILEDRAEFKAEQEAIVTELKSRGEL